MTTRGRLSLRRRILLSSLRLWGIVMSLLNCMINERVHSLRFIETEYSALPFRRNPHSRCI